MAPDVQTPVVTDAALQQRIDDLLKQALDLRLPPVPSGGNPPAGPKWGPPGSYRGGPVTLTGHPRLSSDSIGGAFGGTVSQPHLPMTPAPGPGSDPRGGALAPRGRGQGGRTTPGSRTGQGGRQYQPPANYRGFRGKGD